MKLQEKQSGKNKRYYLKITVTVNGQRKQKEFPMGKDKKTATSRAKRFQVTLEESGLEAALEELNGGSPLKKGDSPKAEQMEKLYREYQEQSPKPCRPNTIYNNVLSLKTIMKKMGAKTIQDINPNDLRKILLPKNPTDAQLRGFSSNIANAKSIFKPACLNFYEKKGVKIKNIFLGVELTAPQVKPYIPMAGTNLDKIKENLHTLPACEQIVFLLSFYFGLRRIEVEHCKTSWFTDDGQKIYLSVQDTDDFKVKTNEGRVFPVGRKIYDQIMELRNTLNPKNDFVAYKDSTTVTARLEMNFRRLTEFLRTHGMTGTRPIQILRKECGSRIVSETKSIFEAQRVLGHSTPTTTAKHYANIINLATVGEEVVEQSPEEKLAKSIGISVEELRKRLGI